MRSRAIKTSEDLGVRSRVPHGWSLPKARLKLEAIVQELGKATVVQEVLEIGAGGSGVLRTPCGALRGDSVSMSIRRGRGWSLF